MTSAIFRGAAILFIASCTGGAGGAGRGESSHEIGGATSGVVDCSHYRGLASPAEIALTPRENTEAEILAIEATGSFLADPVIYQRIVDNLVQIRHQFPETSQIRAHSGGFANGMLVNFRHSPAPDDWECMNERYRANIVSRIPVAPDSHGGAGLEFDGIFNMVLLATEYEKLPRVESVFLTARLGIQEQVCLVIDGETYWYIFSTPPESCQEECIYLFDCPEECKERVHIGVSTDSAGAVYLRGRWSSPVDLAPAWYTPLAATCRARRA